MKELIVALDLELNQPSRRVVQIGAVLGSVRTGEVVSQFDLNPNNHARQLKRVVDNCTTHRRMLEAAKKSADSE